VNKIIIFAFSLAVVWGGVSLHAQTQKIGFVVSSKIFQELPEAQEAQKRLEAIAKPVQDSIAAMRKELQMKVDEYQKKEGLLNDASKKTLQQEFQDLQRRATEYAQVKDEELAKQREKILAPLNEKIVKAIAAVAKEEKYTFVLDKTEPVSVLLYGDASHELTFKVLDKLKRGK
jgi:outer membrane protein